MGRDGIDDDAACRLFDWAVADVDGHLSPIGLRNLLVAARLVGEIDRPLPRRTVASLRDITGIRHGTYRAAARQIAQTQFTHSGGFLASLLISGLPVEIETWIVDELAARADHPPVDVLAELASDVGPSPPFAMLRRWLGAIWRKR